jgi:MGT family glycosyltransferase
MSTILAYTSPAIGDLFPLTPLLLELQHRGHIIHLRTLSSRVDDMRRLGFQVEAIDSKIEQVVHDDFKAKSAKASLTASSAVFNRRGVLDAEDFRRTKDQIRPDLAIVDVNCWGAAFTAEALGDPWVSFAAYTPPLSSPGTPPFGPGLTPMGGPLGRIRDAIVKKAVLGAVEKAMLPSVNSLRSGLGLAAATSADDLYRKAPLLLVATSKPFEYATTEWGPNVVMIGASVWEPPSAPPDWLEAIEEPIALVTTSSVFQDDGILVRTALEAFAGQPVHIVATMPAGLADDLQVPANATIRAFLPHRPVLDRAVVAITHGGMGATQKALALGVPVCVVPFGRDQLEVARRVEVSDSGTRLPAKNLTPQHLRNAITEAMTKRAGAQRVAAGYVATGGAATGANAIEQRFVAVPEHQVSGASAERPLTREGENPCST